MRKRCLFIYLCLLIATLPLLWAEKKQEIFPLLSPIEENTQNSETNTIIESDYLEMESTLTHNFFLFKKNVRVRGNNFLVTCNQLEVFSKRKIDEIVPNQLNSKEKKDAAKFDDFGDIERILATGQVEIFQGGRQAFAGCAEVLPQKGKIILSENPRVIDENGTVSGWRITLLQGEERAIVENAPKGTENTQRPTVILQPLEEFDFEKRKHNKAKN
jgi:lipopolysaccharide export system protein LptA